VRQLSNGHPLDRTLRWPSRQPLRSTSRGLRY
jgi:hypothetical protein